VAIRWQRSYLFVERSATKPLKFLMRRDARVVEWGGLENRCASNRTGGSNPSPSANSPLLNILRASCGRKKLKAPPAKPLDRLQLHSLHLFSVRRDFSKPDDCRLLVRAQNESRCRELAGIT
jgi:hypothetical protein